MSNFKIMYPKKQISKTLEEICELLNADLQKTGGKPFNCGWQNVGALQQLGKNVYHCHLNRKNVAIWTIEKFEQDIVCRYIYIGTREKARYKKN